MRLRHPRGAISASLLTASCYLAVENEFAATLLDGWDRGRCSLRDPLPRAV